MKTVAQLRVAEKKANLNAIELAVVKNVEVFTSKVMLAPDLLNGVNRETVDFILTTIFEAGLVDELEIIRCSKKTGKYVRQYITTKFLAE